MIKTQHLVPEVYYKRSRDFQVLGRTVDFLIGYLKTATNAVENIPLSQNFDLSLVDLLATTLGFKRSHEYNAHQLLAFCSAFPLILKNKGNIKSIQYILTLMANVQDINEPVLISMDGYTLYVYVPEDMEDLALFEDTLDYILPAGISCRIVNSTFIKDVGRYDTYGFNDTAVKHTNIPTLDQSQIMRWTDESGNLVPTPINSDIGISRMDNITEIPLIESESGN